MATNALAAPRRAAPTSEVHLRVVADADEVRPAISVCIVTGRRDGLLGACLASLRAQVDAPPTELLVCADGDARVAEAVHRVFPDARVCLVRKALPGAGRNLLVERARGEITVTVPAAKYRDAMLTLRDHPELKFEQFVRVDMDRVRVDGGGGRDRAGDDLALNEQALHPRLDQALAELVEIENARDEDDQRDKVEEQNAAREAGEDRIAEQAPDQLERIGPVPPGGPRGRAAILVVQFPVQRVLRQSGQLSRTAPWPPPFRAKCHCRP